MHAVSSTPAPPDGEPRGDGAESLRREWLRLLVATLARTALILLVSLAGWAAVPALWGWQPTTVMSGSMAPQIRTGDVVVTRAVDASELLPGRVVLADDPDQADRLRLHRVVRLDDAGALILRGDANGSDDATAVHTAAVHGVGFLRVPYVGLPVVWVATGQWLKVGAVAGALALFLWASTLDRALHRSRHRGDPPPRGATGSRRPAEDSATASDLATLGLTPGGRAERRAHRLAAAERPAAFRPRGRRSIRLGTAVAVSALVLGTVPLAAQAAFTATAPNPSNAFAAAAHLSCGAAVLADGPGGFYQFDADTGSVVGDSVNPGSNDGSFQGPRQSAGPACPGDGGAAAVFNGTSNSITTPAQGIPAPQVFSYEMWLRTTSTTGGKLMSFGVSLPLLPTVADNRVLYLLDSGQLRFGLTPNTANFVTSPLSLAVNDGRWHHVAVSLSGAGMSLFVDGVRTNTSPAVTSAPAGTGSWTIGTGAPLAWTAGRTNTFFQGELDNVALFTGKALTPAQVAAHFAAGRAPAFQP